MIKNYRFLIPGLLCLLPCFADAQLSINNGQVYIPAGATIMVLGDVSSNNSILGNGKILLKGSSNQQVNMNGNTIPNLEIDNTSNISLTGDIKVSGSLQFTSGKISTGNFNLRLANIATVSGQGTSKFVETTGTGQLQKDISTNLTDYELPLGSGTSYNPVFITTTGTYSNAFVGAQDKGTAHPGKHIRSTDYLKNYWPLTQTGITGTLNAKGQYADPVNITGVESSLIGFFWNGTAWALTGIPVNTGSNQVAATITGNGDLYAMNKYVLSRPKVFLQGAYNSGTGLMDDKLRNSGTYSPGVFPASNLLPLSDPYRTAPLNTSFTQVNNSAVETIDPSVLNDQTDAATNIVDWVFLELRDNSTGNPGSHKVQTRSALLRRDGVIVDIDGTSPVYFKDIDAGSTYTLVVRHRNHLGLSTDPTANLQTLGIAAPAGITDFTIMTDAQLFGTTAAFATTNGKNLLFAGNINGNNNVRYNGPSNDRDHMLSTILGGNQGTILSNVYSTGDVNMNRGVRYNGPSNDRDFILSTPLNASQATIRTEALPN